MGARFLAGVAAGLAWALLAGYARRIAPPHLQGRAVAVAMTGVPLALSLGVPAGTFLGEAVGWRTAFTAMTLIAVALLGWIALAVPDLPGEARGGRAPVARTLKVPGVLPVLAVTFTLVLAHTVLYTYVAAYLGRIGLAGSTGLVLLVFGGASLAGIWFTGRHIDRRLRTLTLAGTILFAVAAALLAVPSGGTALVLTAAVLWGSAGAARPPCCRPPSPTRAGTTPTPPRRCWSASGTLPWPRAVSRAASCSTPSARAPCPGRCSSCSCRWWPSSRAPVPTASPLAGEPRPAAPAHARRPPPRRGGGGLRVCERPVRRPVGSGTGVPRRA